MYNTTKILLQVAVITAKKMPDPNLHKSRTVVQSMTITAKCMALTCCTILMTDARTLIRSVDTNQTTQIVALKVVLTADYQGPLRN